MRVGVGGRERGGSRGGGGLLLALSLYSLDTILDKTTVL